MFLLANTQLFANVPTSPVLLDAACEKLMSFAIYDVVIQGRNQQYSKSIVKKHFVTFPGVSA